MRHDFFQKFQGESEIFICFKVCWWNNHFESMNSTPEILALKSPGTRKSSKRPYLLKNNKVLKTQKFP